MNEKYQKIEEKTAYKYIHSSHWTNETNKPQPRYVREWKRIFHSLIVHHFCSVFPLKICTHSHKIFYIYARKSLIWGFNFFFFILSTFFHSNFWCFSFYSFCLLYNFSFSFFFSFLFLFVISLTYLQKVCLTFVILRIVWLERSSGVVMMLAVFSINSYNLTSSTEMHRKVFK